MRHPRNPLMNLPQALACLTVSLGLAGCARDFPPQPYGPAERDHMALLAGESDFHSRLELARLHVEHNEMDQADALLQPLVAQDPSHAEALAWYGANNCKIAGRKGPWLMGLDKMMLAKSCLKQIQQALAMAPDDFTIQMIALHTGASVNAFGGLDMARAEMDKLATRVARHPQAYPPTALFSYHYACAAVERAAGNLPATRQHLVQALAFDVSPAHKQQAQRELDPLD